MANDLTAAERERLAQELLELHFDCHPDPDALRARLAAEPALRALQQQVLATAQVLQRAAQPAQPPLRLAGGERRAWWRRPSRRLAAGAAAATLVVGAFAAHWGLAARELAQTVQQHCQLTISAPRALPAGVPWSFTIESEDVHGSPVATEVAWRVLDAESKELAAGTATARGRSTVAMAAGLATPRRLEVAPLQAGGPGPQSLRFESTVAPPLVHVTTDKPVYRPGEPVWVRAVLLDRCSLQPSPAAEQVLVGIRDAKGGLVHQEAAFAAAMPAETSATAACVWQVPAASAGGVHTIEVTTRDGAVPTERQTFVVRAYAAPRLQKDIVLDRKTYQPGERGSAQVTVQRLGGDVAAGARVRGSLLLDGDEVWSQDAQLDERGQAIFRFAVPAIVRQGAALFTASIADGGVRETAVEPFVVPTGEVLAAAFPEGGELIAGIDNRVYVELTDALGRPVEGAGVIESERGERCAEFLTVHQGRARCTFTPELGVAYRLRCTGMRSPLSLPVVADRGVVLQSTDSGAAAGAALQLRIAGRGDGPWLVGVFCRGALLAQRTVNPDAEGAVDTRVAMELPLQAAGVLRVTVFDRTLRPIAERLVQRPPQQRLQLAIAPGQPAIVPGATQQVVVRATDEQGQPIAGAVLGVTVTDGGALAMGSEPRIGLLDHLLLFADCEQLLDLDRFVLGSEHGARNVDLVLGTRGWRRFVWRNDDAARAAIARAPAWGRDQLVREGFAQEPQVASNRAAALAAIEPARAAVHAGRRDVTQAAGIAALALLTISLLELVLWLLQLRPLYRLAGLATLAASTGAALLALLQLQGRQVELAAMAPGAAFVADGAAVVEFRGKAAERGAELFLGARMAGVPGRDPVLEGDQWAGEVAGVPEPAGAMAEAAPDPRPAGFVEMKNVPVPAAREYAHRRQAGPARSDFTETVCWQPLLRTDADGSATLRFDTSDAVTRWNVHVDAHGAGRVGQGSATFATRLPLHAEAKLPVEVSAGDRLLVPVAIESTAGDDAATVSVQLTGPLELVGENRRSVALTNGRGRVLLPVTVGTDAATGTLAIRTAAGAFADEIRQSIAVAARGFPHGRSWGGKLVAGTPTEFVVPLPADSVRGSGKLWLRVFPSPLAGMAQGLDGLLQEPCGCFEQASSSNYPNVMVLSYLQASGDDVPALAARARELLPRGYERIRGYECKERGYEWFGGDPGHEALTAYGLLQFHDMQRVHEVDGDMVRRTTAWLLARRDGQGGYRRSDRALDSFGRAPQQVTDAYVTFALLEAGTLPAELGREIEAVAARAATTDDAYELALCAGALGRARHAGAAAARQRLQAMQRTDGSLCGTTTSITSSGGEDLVVETTAWATLAWLPDPAFGAAARAASGYLQQQRSARGTFGATQATICALRALTAHAAANRTMQAAGSVAVYAGDRRLAERQFAAGQAEPIEFSLWQAVAPGEQTLRLELTSGAAIELPWALDLGYHSELPADDPDAAVAIATRLRATRVTEGAIAAVEVTVTNRRAEGQPMAIALVGLPAGLDLPTRVLEERQRAGDFDLWELRGRELALYWRSLAPGVERRVALELVAAIPGTTTGPASRAYLYYTPQQKLWAPPLTIEVTPDVR